MNPALTGQVIGNSQAYQPSEAEVSRNIRYTALSYAMQTSYQDEEASKVIGRAKAYQEYLTNG